MPTITWASRMSDRASWPKAAPFLEQAQKIDPSSYDNGYDLALAYFSPDGWRMRGSWSTSLLKLKNTAELHNLLGEIEEKDGKFVTAANEYETAAHADPSESNLFDWGSELLLHRTLGPGSGGFSARQLNAIQIRRGW